MSGFSSKIKIGLLLLVDIVILYLALWLMLKLRFGPAADLMWQKHFLAFSIIYPLWILSFYIFGLYDLNLAKNTPSFYWAILKATILNGLLSTTLFYLFPNFLGVTPKTNLFLNLLFFGILFSLWRRLYNSLIKSSTLGRKVMIIGKSSQTLELKEKIDSNPQLGYKVISIIDPEKTDEIRLGLQNISPPLHTLVCAVNLNTHPELTKNLYNSLSYFNFESFPDFYEKITGKVPLSQIDEFWFLNNLKERGKITYEKMKRLLDVAVGLMAGIVTALIFPLVTLAIKLNSPGPVFYKQIRKGKNGKPFGLYKFRSMKVNEREHEELWREKSPDQITKIGKLLRQTHIDELPQSWSILKGDLSLTGPRPEWIKLGEIFEKEISFYFQRYLVKPGVTGWAQLHFPASLSVEEAREKFQYDLYYIKNRSLFLDLKIILKTVNTLLKGGTL